MQCSERTIDFGKVTARKIFFASEVNVARDVQSHTHVTSPWPRNSRSRCPPFVIRSSPEGRSPAMHHRSGLESRNEARDFANQRISLWRDRTLMPTSETLHVVVKRWPKALAKSEWRTGRSGCNALRLPPSVPDRYTFGLPTDILSLVRSAVTNAEAHIPTQPSSPLKDARISFSYEDQERSRGVVPPAC